MNRLRFRNVLLGGMVSGLGGAFFTLGSVGAFSKNMTAGKGFIALAAMIFGRWSPLGAIGAALLFGFADQLQSVLSIIGTPIPSQFMLMAPYLATLFAVAGLAGKSGPRLPTACPTSSRERRPSSGPRRRRLGRAAGRGRRGDGARLRAVLAVPGRGWPAWSTTGGRWSGCNVENASYGVSLCAECGMVSRPARHRGRAAGGGGVRRPAWGRPHALRALPTAALGARGPTCLVHTCAASSRWPRCCPTPSTSRTCAARG